MANPVTNITAARTGIDVTKKNSETPAASATIPMTNRRHSGDTQCRAP